jgi:hypothetical protein
VAAQPVVALNMCSERADPTTAPGTMLAVVEGVGEELVWVDDLPQAAIAKSPRASSVAGRQKGGAPRVRRLMRAWGGRRIPAPRLARVVRMERRLPGCALRILEGVASRMPMPP